MKTIGEKIRGVRDLKGISQENMAAMLDMTVLAYGEIERGKSDIKLSRLLQIAEKLGTTLAKVLNFDETVSNFFDQCSGVIGLMNNGVQHNHFDEKELLHKLEKLELEKENLKSENARLRAEKEKADLKAEYWQEKYERISEK